MVFGMVARNEEAQDAGSRWRERKLFHEGEVARCASGGKTAEGVERGFIGRRKAVRPCHGSWLGG